MKSANGEQDTDVRVQFLAFAGCPLADAAREALNVAAAEVALSAYEEIDILDASTSEKMRGWGSPTILVDGMDVAGSTRGEGAGCRIYSTDTRVPEVALIARKIREARQYR